MASPAVAPPSTTSAPASSSSPAQAPAGLSAFVARVLDQLSVSAWLPAAFLLLGAYCAVQVRLAGGDLEDALSRLGGTTLEGLVLLLGAIVVLTTLTQAFEFGAIRLLEGYWGCGRVQQAIADRLSKRFVRRRRSAAAERSELLRRAWATARLSYGQFVDDIEIVNYIEADLADMRTKPTLTSEQLAKLNDNDWQPFASPDAMRRLAAHEAAVRRLPAPHRILPTRLGNTLRSHEDRANTVLHGSVEGMVHRTYHRLPVHLQVELDQYRNRLGLYASLVATSAVLSVFASAVTYSAHDWALPICLAGGLWLSATFYRAAISSADAYGGMLQEIAQLQTSGELPPA